MRAVRAKKQDDFTCVRGRYAFGEHAVCDDIKHTERKHHRQDDEAELEHILHVSLQKERNIQINVSKDYFHFVVITVIVFVW